MWEVNEHLIEAAKKEAAAMLLSGETIRAVSFGDKKSSIFVTTDHSKVCGTDSFNLEGKSFYLGWKT